jgi:hypothetical protein
MLQKIRSLFSFSRVGRDPLEERAGSEVFEHPVFIGGILAFGAFAALAIAKFGLIVGFLLVGAPFGIFYMGSIVANPRIGISSAILVGFFSAGIARYVAAPWGLLIDIVLFVAWLGLLFKKFNKTDWTPLKNDICLLALIWYGYIFMELVNPEMISATAWFYAMRGVGFYQLLTFGLVFMLYRKPKYLDQFLYLIGMVSVFGTLWGFRQMLFGTDAAEDHWLFAEGHEDEHVLHGVLRVFSFYSDAGQFGASQAMMSMVFGLICLGPISWSKRIFYGVICISCFLGFAISGTRGALAVPAAGVLMYLIVSKNFKILISGLLTIGIIYYILRFTFLFQGVEQVRRMRTGLDPNSPSLMVRLNNQKTFGRYLASRPLGGGVGTAGFWGARFSPHTLLANTATDSYYVKIWAETGIVGICLHLFILGYFVGKGGYIVWNLKDEELRYKIMALYSGMGGVLLASYGNQVFSQMPTGMIMNVSIPLIFLAPLYDKIIAEEKEAQREKEAIKILKDGEELKINY